MVNTNDSIVDKNLVICQPAKGFRFAVDAVYLAWFVKFEKQASLIDIGSGSGVVSALLAFKKGFSDVCAVEYQKRMFSCLKTTVEQNKLEVVTPVNADIRTYKPDREFNIAVCNPPYRHPDTGRVPEDETELNARFTTTLCAEDVFRFCRSYLKNSGSLYLSYDADMTADLFEAGFKYGFEPKRLRSVCPDLYVKPKIVLMEFRKNAGREMSFEPPLYQKINGEQSEEDKNIMQGRWIDKQN
ncbi:methyltransferase small [Denitrovibrio acetiphilus DSM 12809]|uniref:Methyltransferase small n=2 Tax=Denitrovibrio TaxID=117999 RepID=D4H623_DENA2|nr:methyltransferase small [Denitrovibrio acetiphilus DSM 12809]